MYHTPADVLGVLMARAAGEPLDELLAGRLLRPLGMTGGTGTCVYTDPAEGLIGILLTQRAMTSPVWPTVFTDFWTCTYQAIDD